MHYRNGREANIGDPVVGTVFNNGGRIIAGTLVSLTPGNDSCSAMVGYNITVPSDAIGNLPAANPQIGGQTFFGATPVKVQGTQQHGAAGMPATTYYVQDYTECKHLMHAEGAWSMANTDAPTHLSV